MLKPFSQCLRLAVLATLLATTVIHAKPALQARAETIITVDTQADDETVDGLCSLREAIRNANLDDARATENSPDCAAGSGADTILFGDGIGTILLNATLPHVTDPDGLTIQGGGDVRIDGQSLYQLFYVDGVPLTIDSLSLVGGNTIYDGGAIASSGLGSALTITRSYFASNHGRNGGAIHSENSIVNVANSVFFENSSDLTTGKGGAVVVLGRTATFMNNTFSGNRASLGGDLYTYGNTASLVNNLFARHRGGGHCSSESGSSFSGHHNLFQDAANTCGFVHGVDGNLTGIDPLFESDKVTPSAASPAVGAGDNLACANAPVNNTSYNGLPRPYGIRCEMGAYEMLQTPIQSSFASASDQDGWILESAETSGRGGTKNIIATTFRVGDDAQNRQYRSILSFDTATLPDDVVVVSARLSVKYAGKTGTLPFSTHSNLLVDVKKGAFTDDPSLQSSDFQTAASKGKVLSFNSTKVDGWYSKAFNAANLQYINLGGLTQFRLRFRTDDNNDFGADFLSLYSGNADPANLPLLIIEYYDR